MAYGNNNAIIEPLPNQGTACNQCGPLVLNPKGIERGETGTSSVFVGLFKNDPATDQMSGVNPSALFTTGVGRPEFTLTIQNMTDDDDSSYIKSLMSPTYTQSELFKNSAGTISLQNSGSILTGLTANGNVTATGTLNLSSSSATHTITKHLSVGENLTVGGDLTVDGGMTIFQDKTVKNNLTVEGNTTLSTNSSAITEIYGNTTFKDENLVKFDNGLSIVGGTLEMNARTLNSAGTITTTGTVAAGVGDFTNALVDTPPSVDKSVVRRVDINIGTSISSTFNQPKVVVAGGYITGITEGTNENATSHGGYHATSTLTTDAPATGSSAAGAISAEMVKGVRRDAPVLKGPIKITDSSSNYTHADATHGDGTYTGDLFKIIGSTEEPDVDGPAYQVIFRKATT